MVGVDLHQCVRLYKSQSMHICTVASVLKHMGLSGGRLSHRFVLCQVCNESLCVTPVAGAITCCHTGAMQVQQRVIKAV